MAQPDRIYELGPFRLDTGARRLLKENRPVSFPPKSFDLLQILVENQGRAMSKAQLLEALWPDTQVEEGSLTFQVSVLRKALGPEVGAWIETIPRYGYRFSPPVVPNPIPDTPAPALASSTTPHRVRKRYLIATVLAVMLIGSLIVTQRRGGVVASDRNPSPNAVVAPRAVPLTAFHGIEKDPAVSPDGKYVAFTWDGERQDNFDIYVIEIASRTLRRMTFDPAPDISPAWSPDGRSIAFLRRTKDNRSVLLIVPSSEGGEYRIGETRNDQVGRPDLSLLEWSPDGRSIAASHREGSELHEAIYLFSLTGEKRRLTTPPEDTHGDHMPAFSPDGRKLAFCRLEAYSQSEVYLLPLDKEHRSTTEARRLTSHKRWSVNPVWASGSSEVWYVLSQNAIQTSREVRIAGIGGNAPPRRSLNLDDEAAQISGRRHLVYSKRSQDTNIWRAEIPALGEQPGLPELFISSTMQDGKVKYSPDGKKISFISSRSGSDEVWTSNADGSGQVGMTSFGGPLIGPPA